MTTLKEAFNEAKNRDWENGLATNPVTVERTTETVDVIRKCGSDTHPEIYLLIAKPRAGYVEPNTTKLGKDIKDALDIYGDITIVPKSRNRGANNEYDIVLDAALV